MIKKLGNSFIYMINILLYLSMCITLMIKKDFQSVLLECLIIGNIWIAAWSVKNDLEEELWKNIDQQH